MAYKILPYQFNRLLYTFGLGLYTFTRGLDATANATNGEQALNFAPLALGIGLGWLLSVMTDARDFYRFYQFPSWFRNWITI